MSSSTESAQDLRLITFDKDHYCDQIQSPLYSILPGEIRDRIFAFTLAEYEDTSKVYDANTCYRRPDYAAPRRSDTALLRTCQRVYGEAFFYPYSLAEHVLWFTAADRRPQNVTTIARLTPCLALMHKLHGNTELASVRIFAQLYTLESGATLRTVLQAPYFFPRTMTVTLRHTDLWFWESDEPIYIDGNWTAICRLPNSVRSMNVQVESLERRKNQVDYIVSDMLKKWHFQRRDDTILSASPASVTISRWSGSSTWNNARWLRDESQPETIDYYVANVCFRPRPCDAPSLKLLPYNARKLGPMPNAVKMQHTRPSVTTTTLRDAGIPAGCTADEVFARLDEYARVIYARTQHSTLQRAQNIQTRQSRVQNALNRLSRSGSRVAGTPQPPRAPQPPPPPPHVLGNGYLPPPHPPPGHRLSRRNFRPWYVPPR